MVINQQSSIYRASKKLKISNSTAKAILKNYEKLGTIL
jgi:molybdenum-dependent DNA-binding transcriptional regulator ModE